MQLTKNNVLKLERELDNKKRKFIALLAPSFVADFEYPAIIFLLKKLGFDKIVELTFGAKMINREYHGLLSLEKKDPRKKETKLVISSVCPGIVNFIKEKYPQFEKNLIPVDSPMIATAKICKKFFPKHKVVFIAPCGYKKIESENSKYVDYVLDYIELRKLLDKKGLELDRNNKTGMMFDRFYNDYTKIYPLSGGLTKTAHLKGVLKKGEERVIDGIIGVERFLKEKLVGKHKEVRFLDVTFCVGGCIGGPCLTSRDIEENKNRVMLYLEISKREKKPLGREGLIKKAKSLSFLIKTN